MTSQVGSQAVAVTSPGKSNGSRGLKAGGEWAWQLLTAVRGDVM